MRITFYLKTHRSYWKILEKYWDNNPKQGSPFNFWIYLFYHLPGKHLILHQSDLNILPKVEHFIFGDPVLTIQ